MLAILWWFGIALIPFIPFSLWLILSNIANAASAAILFGGSFVAISIGVINGLRFLTKGCVYWFVSGIVVALLISFGFVQGPSSTFIALSIIGDVVLALAAGRLLLQGRLKRLVEYPLWRLSRYGSFLAEMLSERLTASLDPNLHTFIGWTEGDEAFDVVHLTDRVHHASFQIPAIGFSDNWETFSWYAFTVGVVSGIVWGFRGLSAEGIYGHLSEVVFSLPFRLWIALGASQALVQVIKVLCRTLYPIALPLVTTSILVRRIAYGVSGLREAILADYLCDVAVTRTPAYFAGQVCCYAWEREYKGMRHALHSNPEVIRDIVRWLQACQR